MKSCLKRDQLDYLNFMKDRQVKAYNLVRKEDKLIKAKHGSLRASRMGFLIVAEGKIGRLVREEESDTTQHKSTAVS